jgi:raffinose/stachyose/melibiose transport system permease protein
VKPEVQGKHVARAGTRGHRATRPGDRWYHGWLFVLPALVVYAFFVLYSAAMTLWYSFHTWRGVGEAQWAGLANYARLIGEPTFLKAVVNNLTFAGFYTLVPLFVGLVLASVLSQPWLRGGLVFRTLLFLPQVLPMVLIGVVWRWMYHPVFGPVNESLRALGLGAWARPWLGDFDWALPSVGFVASWYFYGFCMVVFVAGIQKIDQSLYDAARVDGANEVQQFRHVTIPGLRREIFVVLIFTFIAALKVFDLVFVTTRGGPGNQTLVASLYLYRNAFQQNLVGYGASVAVVITVLVVVIALALRRYQEAGE